MPIVVSEFQDQLLRGLTHRMNNILSLFHGYLGLLMDDKKLDPAAKEGLAKIKVGAKAASDLMERTTGLVRPASAVPREIQVGDLIRQMKPTFESFCTGKVRLQLDSGENIPALWVEPSRIRMALTELVRNACEAAKAKVVIRVASWSEGEGQVTDGVPANWVRLTVTDDGPGIPVESAERIYVPFYTTKRNQQSAGLGLTIALGCAQQLEGTLLHDSRPGETTFELLLPVRAPGSGASTPVA